MSDMTLSIAHEFTTTPGPRFERQGKWSGEEFRRKHLQPKFAEARLAGTSLLVDLDGTAGYATSFLEEAFGGLARSEGIQDVLRVLRFKSDEEPLLLEEVSEYIRDCGMEQGELE